MLSGWAKSGSKNAIQSASLAQAGWRPGQHERFRNTVFPAKDLAIAGNPTNVQELWHVKSRLNIMFAGIPDGSLAKLNGLAGGLGSHAFMSHPRSSAGTFNLGEAP